MFKKYVLGLFVLSLFACTAEIDNKAQDQANDQTNDQETVKRQLAGGWSKTDVTPDVEKALDFVLMQMNTSAKPDKIVAVKTQIVKGKNFDITFELDNKQQWNCIVYRDLDGTFSMSKVATQLK